MGTYTQILYHIVFATKYRRTTLQDIHSRKKMYTYMAGIISNRKSKPIIINGVEDHLHILTHVHPSVCLSDLVRDIKLSSNKFIKTENIFPQFEGWQEGYGAFTCSARGMNSLRSYIANQEIHHQKMDSKEELIQLLTEHGVKWDDAFLI